MRYSSPARLLPRGVYRNDISMHLLPENAREEKVHQAISRRPFRRELARRGVALEVAGEDDRGIIPNVLVAGVAHSNSDICWRVVGVAPGAKNVITAENDTTLVRRTTANPTNAFAQPKPRHSASHNGARQRFWSGCG